MSAFGTKQTSLVWRELAASRDACFLLVGSGAFGIQQIPAAPTNNELRTWSQNFFEFFWRGPMIFRF
jgi:hypothetical protein